MTTLRERPAYHLTRHFFAGLFEMGFLSDVGVDSFKRMIAGCGAAFLAFGLLLVRLFAAKYANLAASHSAEPYRQALLADHAFLLAVPMWIVAIVAVLVSHSLFPDETDFRVLMGLPVTRRQVFGAKLLFVLMSIGRWAETGFALQLTAYFVVSLLASGFSVLAVTAIHGVLVLTAPRGRLLAASAALRSVMMCALVISLAFVARLPAQAAPFADGSWWLSVVPPAWFLGLERWLLGDHRAHLVHLARIAGLAAMLAAALAAGSYILLYRRFDRVMLQQRQERARSSRCFSWRPRSRAIRTRPVFAASRMFTLITLRRSVLHQGILVGLSAAGGGLVVNSLMAADLAGWWAHGGVLQAGLMASVIWAPFALMFVASLAVRLALAVPIEQRANWIFRMTERDAARADQLDAAVHTVRWLGAIIPVALVAPVQWLVLGRDAIAASLVALLCGSLLVEILMKDWARIPFTCSYIPGSGFVPQTILTGLVSFVAFTGAGAGLARLNFTGHPGSLAADAIVCSAVWLLRRRRLNRWKDAPLLFEDQLPTEVNPLRLSVD